MGFESLSPAKKKQRNTQMNTSLETQIRQDALAARRASDRVRSNLLTTLLAEAERRAKDELRALNDEDLRATLRYFLKNLERSIAARPSPEAQAEVEMLRRYLPMETLPTMEEAVEQVLAENRNMPVKRLVGLVMRARRGSANPALVEKMLEERIASQ
jgi:uncharacterized protein YqeY